MKGVLIYLLFLPLIGYCDTLDYWTVYLNDSIIGQYNTTSTENCIEVNRNSINVTDTIYIKYGNDHTCNKCEYYYALKDINFGVKLHVERKYKILEKISFPLIVAKDWKRSNEFEIFLMEDNYLSQKQHYTLLLQIIIIE